MGQVLVGFYFQIIVSFFATAIVSAPHPVGFLPAIPLAEREKNTHEQSRDKPNIPKHMLFP